MQKAILAFAFTCILCLVLSSPFSPSNAPPCPSDGSCVLPNCRCSSTDIPGGFAPINTPQIVFLTFDDAVTPANFPFYEEIFSSERKNPNGATIKGTFFVVHEYNNYSMIHELHRRGHEIGMHSITHRPTTGYWANLNESMWNLEVVAQREQMQIFAKIPRDDIRGMRAPFLQIGGDPMYKAISSGGFTYECSRPTRNQRAPGLWPYTNDFATIQDCNVPPCPRDAYPGFWTVPIIDFLGDDTFPCAMADECTPVPETQKQMYDLLRRNFDEHYNGNRAPFGVFAHAAWLVGPDERPEFGERKAGYIQFLDYLATRRDVFVVTISQALEWIKSPTTVSDIMDFAPWQDKPLVPNDCIFWRNCFYTNGTWERYMGSCVPCPAEYPWLGNHLGSIIG